MRVPKSHNEDNVLCPKICIRETGYAYEKKNEIGFFSSCIEKWIKDLNKTYKIYKINIRGKTDSLWPCGL